MKKIWVTLSIIGPIIVLLTWLANQGTGIAWLNNPSPAVLFGIKQGFILAAIFLGGVLLINKLKRYHALAAVLLLALITPLALGGLWFSSGFLGISDWDYYFSYHEVVRKMVLEYKTIPQWNPYICGGTSAIGDPEFPLFTPTFALELLFGVPTGLRLAAWFATAIGAIGVFFLGRHLRLSLNASLLAALAAAFGSVNILEIVEGHPNIFAAMWLPWILLTWAKAYAAEAQEVGHASARNRHMWPAICGILLALTFFQGGIYLLMYLTGALLFLVITARRRISALLVTLQAAGWAFGLAAIKLLPVLLWLTQFQDQMYASSSNTIANLHKIFIGRYLHGQASENVLANQGGGWHEYGAYLGPFIIALAATALVKFKSSRLTKLLFFSAILAIVVSSAGPILKPIFDVASFLPRSNISRLILFAVIPLAILAGQGADSLINSLRRQSHARLAWYLIIFVIAADLMSLSYPLSQQAFVIPWPAEHIQPAQPPVQYTIDRQIFRTPDGVDHTRAYVFTKQGYGVMSYCSVLGPAPSVITQQHKGEDSSFITTDDAASQIELISWSPAKTVTQVTLANATNVLLNNNFARGWTINGRPAQEIRGKVGTILPAGKHILTFSYRAPGFLSGSIISLLTILGGIWFIWHIKSRGRDRQ